MNDARKISNQVISGLTHDLRNVLYAVHTMLDVVLAHDIGDTVGVSMPQQNAAQLAALRAQLQPLLSEQNMSEVDQVLQVVQRNEDTVAEGLQQMEEAVGRGVQMLRSLAEFSRIATTERGGETLDLAKIVAVVLEDMGDMMQSAHITVAVDVPSLLEMRGASWHFETIVKNLLKNAWYALSQFDAKPSRQLRIGLSQQDKTYTFTVSDNGPGMQISTRMHLFEPFFTTHASDTLGLGLCTARQLAWLYSGNISVATEPGGGATFIVTLQAE